MATKEEDFGVLIENTALAFSTAGVKAGKWLQGAASTVINVISKGVSSLIDYGKQIWDGAKEFAAAVMRWDLKLFWDFMQDQPLMGLAGGVALGLTGLLVIEAGAAAAGALGITAFVGGGCASLWGAIKSVQIGGILVGSMLPSLQQAVVSTTQTVTTIDWMKSDKSILAELEGSYLSFLNNIGESSGRMLVAIALGGARENPRLTLNITAAAALSITKEIEDGKNISDELVEGMATVANLFIRYAANLAGKLGYLELRKMARNNVRTGNKELDDKIRNWGLIEGQSFTINGAIDAKIEKIKEWNKGVGSLTEGFKEGMSEGFNEMVLMV
jgi:hypothetical protein